MEMWDVLDIHRREKNNTMVRGELFQAGCYHLVVHACLFNEKNEMLIQQRQPFKEGWPNLWDVTCGGSAQAGETSQTAMERELREELGLEARLQNTRPFITVNFEHGFDDYYLLFNKINTKNLLLQPAEVQRVKWAKEKEIIDKIDKGTFIPYYKSFIQLLFAMRGHYGSICS